jgi:hypothetical protein
MRIRFIGEGPDDVGRADHTGVTQILVRRIIAERMGTEPDTSGWVAAPVIRLHRPRGLDEKTRLAMKEAHREGFDAVVVVLDRDGKGSNDEGRLKQLRKGREAASEKVPIHAALGVAIETMEAWLLADETALSATLGCVVPQQPEPEKLAGEKGSQAHPKARLHGLIGDSPRQEEPTGIIKRAIAEKASIKILERRCPAGFKPFATDVRLELCTA